MAEHTVPYFQNDAGNEIIKIGAKEFKCIGANPPFDHPHVYLNMGIANEKFCPYCSTLFEYDADLKSNETVPAGCIFDPAKTA